MHPGMIRAHVELQGVAIELCDYDWPQRYAASEVTDYFVLGLSLTTPPSGSRARFDLPGIADGNIGKLVFMPAGVPLIASCDGGQQTIIRCCLTEERFYAIVGDPGEWTRQDLTASIDLQDRALTQKFLPLLNAVQQPEPMNLAYSEALVQNLVFSLMRALGRQDGVSHYPRGGLAGHQLRLIGERVMQMDAPLPSVLELAATLGMSPRHLLRAFRGSTGSSLRAHLDWVFRQRATRLLAQTALPVSEIAEMLGYRHVSSFSVAFRNSTGVAPSAYRAASRH
jgi:AraC family transcriptional regulator